MAVITPALGDGHILSYCTTSGGSYTAFAKVEKTKPYKIKTPNIVTTKADDTSATRVPGKPDYDGIDVTIRFDAATAILISGWQANQTMLYFKVKVIDGTTTQTVSSPIYGFIEEFDPFGELELNKEIVSTIRIAISGPVTLTAGT